MTRPYELDKLLCLLEERENVLSKIKTIELPEFVIVDNKATPLYKIYLSRFGDLVILRNARVSSSITTSISDIGELVEDMPAELAEAYLTRAMYTTPKSKSLGRITRSSTIDTLIASPENSRTPQWNYLLSIPLVQCLELTSALFNIFKDDLLNNS